jgi:hypothetical protein
MCNLYSITTNQAATAALFRVINRYVGNLAPMPGVFPEYPPRPVPNEKEERDGIMKSSTRTIDRITDVSENTTRRPRQ